ncbi:MAG: non-homologous end joining protein Ku [Acidimicrobiia bacterium]
MPSTIWGGSISFGLVSVPVKLTPATTSRDVSFNQLEAESGARIRYRRVSEQSGEEVPTDQIVKGYEISKGRYVVVEKDELDAIAPKATRNIEIEDFVDLDEIDPIYFVSPYYVLPDKSAAKPYRLLLEAMQELRKVAIGRVVMRGKEHLVAIRPMGDLLCVETMRYADEVIPIEDVGGAPEADLSEKELAMARQLVESLAEDFDAEKYENEYREQLMDLIERKAAGEEVVAEPETEEPAKVLDLMAALEASLQRSGNAGALPDTGTSKASTSKAGTSRADPSTEKAPAKEPTTKKAPAKKPAAKKAAPAKKKRSA